MTVTATFPTRDAAANALEDLANAGFHQDEISVLMSDATKSKVFEIETNSKAAEGTATGAATGGVLGAIAAGLTTVAAVATTGGALVAAGPLVAALTGAGAGGTVGGLTGGLIGLGFNEHEAKLWADDIDKGSILIAVDPKDEDTEGRAREILKCHDPLQVA